MALNKNVDKKEIKKYFVEKGTIKIIPLDPFKLPIHWNKIPKNSKIHYTINPKTNCPICALITPKTKWQRIKKGFINYGNSCIIKGNISKL